MIKDIHPRFTSTRMSDEDATIDSRETNNIIKAPEEIEVFITRLTNGGVPPRTLNFSYDISASTTIPRSTLTSLVPPTQESGPVNDPIPAD